MAALLTYRSRDSFEVRFGRNVPDPAQHKSINSPQRSPSRGKVENEHWAIHNDGNKNARSPSRSGSDNNTPAPTPNLISSSSYQPNSEAVDPEFRGSQGSTTSPVPTLSEKGRTPTYFSAQSYLRYQGDKFIKRFDANCYIAITRKLDTHDVGRNRGVSPDGSPVSSEERLRRALSQIEQPTLVLGIQSDGLFTFAEQQQLAAGIPNAVLKTIDSAEGHDAFLLEFEQVNRHLIDFMNVTLSDIMQREPDLEIQMTQSGAKAGPKTSVSEVDDITAW
jgi:homoserine O-acetyltransferase/O-succinyltransferase